MAQLFSVTGSLMITGELSLQWLPWIHLAIGKWDGNGTEMGHTDTQKKRHY